MERFADYYLKGQDGWRESEKDGRRREMPQHRSLEVKASDGLKELSLDRRIQDIVEEEIASVVSEFDPLSASIIVSDPKSGYVLALANAPDFDPNLFNTAELANQRNRALSDLYEPGSTFKIVAVGGAMNEGLITPTDIIDCTKSTIRRGNRNLRLPSDHHPLGQISVSKVVQKSSNRGAARLGICWVVDGCTITVGPLGLAKRPILELEAKEKGPCTLLKMGRFNDNSITDRACCKCYTNADSCSNVMRS